MQSLSPSQSPSNIQQGFELEQQPHVESPEFPDQSHPVKESVKEFCLKIVSPETIITKAPPLSGNQFLHCNFSSVAIWQTH